VRAGRASADVSDVAGKRDRARGDAAARRQGGGDARADCARGRDIEPRREGRGGAADGRHQEWAGSTPKWIKKKGKLSFFFF
jgi:hypothetical protein